MVARELAVFPAAVVAASAHGEREDGSGGKQQGEAAQAGLPFCRGRGTGRRPHDADMGAEAVVAMTGWTGRGAEVGDGADLWPWAVSG